MHLAVYLPVLFSGLFGVTAPSMARRLPPAPATWLLSAGGVIAAAGSAASLALLAFTLVGLNPRLAARGHWSDEALRDIDPVWTPVAVGALVALAVLTVRAALAALRRLTALHDAYRLAASLPPYGGELAVLDLRELHACAVPGHPGRIVVSTGLLCRLDAAHRRAVLAHERAHLEHRHHLHQSVVQLAAAANPLLQRLPDAVDLACERWADEDAAAICGRRETVADALAHTATGVGNLPIPAVRLAAAVTDVASRVSALRAPAPRLIMWRVGLLVGILTATALTLAEATHDTNRIFELAESAYRHGSR
jgi:Zn-dependent protease with chaperone function